MGFPTKFNVQAGAFGFDRSYQVRELPMRMCVEEAETPKEALAALQRILETDEVAASYWEAL